jgi:hypothetical protein
MNSSGLAVGQRDMFGEGSIMHIADNLIEADFEHAGWKRVLETFVGVDVTPVSSSIWT